jgi:thiosulfate dehydrogenase [quinone] large subunit
MVDLSHDASANPNPPLAPPSTASSAGAHGHVTTGAHRGAVSVQAPGSTASDDQIGNRVARSFAGVARILLGFTFLWAFLDKMFGWGYSTPSGQGWMFGTGTGNPTAGFLKFGTNPSGPFVSFFNNLAPSSPGSWLNWLFMLALLGAGVGLMLGIGMRISSIGATLLLLSMWTAVAPWATYVDKSGATVASSNPLLDEHMIYSATLMLLMFAMAGRYWGLGRWWESRTPSWLN